MKKLIIPLVIGLGLCAIGIFLALTFLPLIPPSIKYDISVDPIIVKDNMGTETHVMIKNTGIETLTNVTVHYGGTARPDFIPILNPGEKVSLSPPDGSDLKEVRVTAAQGIDVIKEYRSPASAPFVGNSGFGG